MVRRPLALCCCPIVSTLWILHRLLVASDRPGLATVRIRIPHSSSQRPDWRRAGSPSATARRRRTSSTGHRRLAAGTARSSSPIERELSCPVWLHSQWHLRSRRASAARQHSPSAASTHAASSLRTTDRVLTVFAARQWPTAAVYLSVRARSGTAHASD